jgi:hypothetical protein
MRRRALLLGAVVTVFAARSAQAHPLHTSVASITASAAGDFTISLRVFVDDFLSHTGAAEPRDGVVPDARIVKYLMRTFVIIDRSGRGVPLKWCGSKRVADLLVICLSGRMPGGLRGARVRYSILSDLFSDQINILQVNAGSRRQSLLFTPAETTRVIG